MTRTRYSRSELIADAVIHGLGVMFALIGGPILIGFVAYRGEGWTVAAVSVYVATLIAMLGISASYHLVSVPKAKEWLRRFDHAAIYLKIAGAYTPFAAISLSGAASGRMLLIGVWAAAILGVAVKLIAPRRFELLSLGLYFVIGWAAIWAVGDISEALSLAAMVLIAIGGGLYTVGVGFHLWRALPFQNAIWHALVLAASVVLYCAMVVEFT